MSLAQYKKKRSQDKTPEPFTGKPGKGMLTFVIQRHQASRLHYDFRLELDGVLKSWAVPKGPSLNPEDRRLAMMVEDHPLDYANFEGIIPKGQYGGGTVMVWDRGVFSVVDRASSAYMPTKTRAESEKVLRAQLKEGHITIIMLGEKLKGEFALIKTHGMDRNLPAARLPAGQGRQDAWLLIKKGDEYAKNADVLKKDKSVITGRSMEEIEKQAAKKKQIWNSKPRDLDIEDLPSEDLPKEIKPMLAETADEPFSKEGWIFEMKWDGYRTIAVIESNNVNLKSRNLKSFNDKFAPIVKSLERFPKDAILDGEVVVVDKDGRPDFGALQDYPESKKGELRYYVFDILHLDGKNLRTLPLIERKGVLEKVIPKNLPGIFISDYIRQNGKIFFEQIQKHNLEGMIGKDGKSIYKEGTRSFHWLKVKTGLQGEGIICGYTEGRGNRKHFGALVLGKVIKGKLTYIGHTGGGFNEKLLEATLKRIKKLETDTCPFEQKPKTNAPVTWVKPQLKCDVKFAEWTKEGLMRQPIFVKVLEVSKVPNVPKAEVSNSEIKTLDTLGTLDTFGTLEIDKRKLKVTNLDKIFWPREKYTKGDLINYYREIAPFILPNLKNRPQSLLRWPNGITGESFFQKNVSNLKLDWMMRARITHDKKKIEYMLVQDEAALIYMINLGCIDLNPWSSRIGKLDYPDYLVIDLDPEDISFEKVVEVAQTCRKVLESLEIESYPKTSGSSGIHIYIPMGAKYTYEQVKNFAHLLCIKINEATPDLTSLERKPKDRQNKIYLDYLQNNRGQTLASVYSVRPKPEAPVSTPLEWSEVTKSLKPTDFTIKNIPARLQKKGDLFKKTMEGGVNIRKIIKKLE